ncbi:MAG: hypothetical protein KKA81_08445 [Bacteroidetes bacterium]|nr:hypothetical protein [Bacteroidota bacterium]
MKKVLSLTTLMVLIILAISCKKDSEEQEDTTPKVTSTDDLVVPQNFNWQTTMLVDVIVDPLPSPLNYGSTMYIQSMNGMTYLKHFMQLSQGYKGELKIPVTETQVRFIYGGTNEIIDIISNEIRFSYVQDTI